MEIAVVFHNRHGGLSVKDQLWMLSLPTDAEQEILALKQTDRVRETKYLYGMYMCVYTVGLLS